MDANVEKEIWERRVGLLRIESGKRKKKPSGRKFWSENRCSDTNCQDLGWIRRGRINKNRDFERNWSQNE